MTRPNTQGTGDFDRAPDMSLVRWSEGDDVFTDSVREALRVESIEYAHDQDDDEREE